MCNYLFLLLKDLPKSRIYRLLRKGEIRVNKKRVKQTYRLEEGDIIRIAPVMQRAKRAGIVKVSDSLAQCLAEAVLYESDTTIVLNKPSGLAVHGGDGVNVGLIEALRLLRTDCRTLELVHRLDRDTSGCLMIAKKRSALLELHRQLRENKVRKCYWALVEGAWSKTVCQIDAPLKKNELASGERMVVVHAEGKSSRTLFRVLERYAGSTLVEAQPVTGRTHQIRVHAKFAGHAIAGDEKYAPKPFNKLMHSRGLRRLFLHAKSLDVELEPGTGRQLVEAPLSPELKNFMKTLST